MTFILTCDLDLQFPASYDHDLLTRESSGQRSVVSEDRVETSGQTEAIALPPLLMWSLISEINNIHLCQSTNVLNVPRIPVHF